MTARVEHIGGCTLYLGDMREIVSTLGPVDCIVTDPPYRLESGGRNGGAEHHHTMSGKFDNRHYANDGNIVACDLDWPDFLPMLSDALPQGHAYFMANNRHVGRAETEALKAGFRHHNILVWDKGTGTPNRWFMKNCEFTLFLFKGDARPIHDCGARQLIRCPNIIEGAHPTEKPVALMEHYIRNSTREGDQVLDPFMGVGATAVACVNLGRRFVGCEINPEYFDETCRRVEAAHRGTMPMFPTHTQTQPQEIAS